MMKKYAIIYLVILLSSSNIYAQPGFQKSYGNGYSGATAMQMTTDGGFIMTGGINYLGAGKADMYLVKTNRNGDLEWTRTFGGAEYDYGWAITQNMEGGYVSVGATMSFGVQEAFYFVKTDHNGNLLQSRTYGNYTAAYAHEVYQTNDSGYVIYGFSNGSNSCSVLIRTDKNGDSLWTKTYSDKIGRSLVQTNGGFVLCGKISNSTDIYITKTDNYGIEVWTKIFGVDSANVSCEKVMNTSDGGYIIVGNSNKMNMSDVLLLKTDSLGNLQWAKAYGGANTEFGYDVKQTYDGGYIASGITYSFGNTNGDAYLVKTDSNGNLLWSKTYGDVGKEAGYTVIQTIGGDYVIAGVTWISGGVYLIKTDSVGYVGCYENNPSTIASNPNIHYNNRSFVLGHINATSTPATVVNSGGVEYTLCVTGIDEIGKLETPFTLYPNPTSGIIEVDLGQTFEAVDITIRNTLGQIVLTKNYRLTRLLRLELNRAAGVYFVEIQTNSGKSSIWKVIKK